MSVAWLLEEPTMFGRPMWLSDSPPERHYWSWFANYVSGFWERRWHRHGLIDDASAAKRFATREEALAFALSLGGGHAYLKATEHEWPDE